MTFLNTTLLFALGLIALPLLIHLFGKQRRKTEVFSSLTFLKNLQTDKMKKLRLRQLILLILRTLGILFLVLAFLRPVFKSASFTGAGKTHSLVMLDLSASMDLNTGDRKPIEMAIEELEQIWRDGDIVSLVVLEDSGLRDIPRADEESRNTDFMKNLSVDGRAENYNDAVNRAEEILDKSEATVKEVIVFSDFSTQMPDSLFERLKDKYHLWFIPVGPEEKPNNIYVEKAEIHQAVFTPGETINLEITFRSTGKTIPQSGVFMSLNGKIISSTQIEAEGQEKTTRSIAFKCPEPGRYRGEIELETSDALLLDNRYNFILQVPEKKKVLLAGEDLLAMNHLSLALKSNERQNFEITQTAGQLSDINFSRFDVLILSDPGTMNRETLKRIGQAVKQYGLGLWILPGERTDIPRLNRYLLTELDLGELSFEENRSWLTWDRIDQNHPVFNGIVEDNGTIDRPLQRVRFKINESEESRKLIFLSNGWSSLVETGVGKGKVWLSSFNADSSSSDWMISGLFAPMVQLASLYLGNGDFHYNTSFVCGGEIVWKENQAVTNQEVSIVEDPVGTQISTTPEINKNGRVLITRDTHWPGFYSLKRNGILVSQVAVNVPKEESDLQPVQFGATWMKNRIIQVKEGQNLPDTLKSKRFGKEISWILLVIALLIFIAESIIARETRIKKNE